MLFLSQGFAGKAQRWLIDHAINFLKPEQMILQVIKNFKFNFFIIFLVAVGLYGCGKPKVQQNSGNEEVQLDVQLLNIDIDLAMLEMDLRSSKIFDCMIASSMKNMKSKDKIIDEIKSSADNQCVIAVELTEATEATFNALKDNGAITSPLYLFSIYKSEGERSKEQRVGVFSSVEQCTEYERHAHELGMPTTKCKEWKSLNKLLDDMKS